MHKNKIVIWTMKLTIGSTLITKNSIKNTCDLIILIRIFIFKIHLVHLNL